jgi:integrase
MGAPLRAVPAALAEEPAAQLIGNPATILLFTDLRGGVQRNSNWRSRVFPSRRCQESEGRRHVPTVTPHDLRHTAASLAVSVRPASRPCRGCWDTQRRSALMRPELLKLCGAKGNRTPDLLDANETRYQLRYSP